MGKPRAFPGGREGAGGGWKRGDDMLKQILVVGASLLLPAIANASDFRTLCLGGTPARSMQVNIAEIDRRVAEPPYALTGKSERQEWRAQAHENFQAGDPHFRPGK